MSTNETTYTIKMAPSSSEANDWYTGYEGEKYSLKEACELANLR